MMGGAKRKRSVLDAFTEQKLRKFFMGRLYPIIVSAIVVIGYLTGTELYLNFINLSLLAVALFVVDSIRPIIPVLCTFVFQISRINTPADFSLDAVANNLYYFEGARGVIFVLSFVPVAIGLVVFFVRNKLINKKSLTSLPLLIPSGIMALAFLLNGAFSGAWSAGNLGFGAIQAFIWFIVPWIFMLGLKNERASELVEYFVYVASLITVILLIEVADIYINTEDLITSSGNIRREFFNYGWGNCNTGAQAFVVLIPVLFVGATVCRNKMQIYYFAMATLALLGVVLNVSRSALLIGGAVYQICIIMSFIKSEKKIRFLIESAIVIVIVVAIAISTKEVIYSVISNYINRGVTDSGRFDIWAQAFEGFKQSPIFGRGFFGLFEKDKSDAMIISSISFLPDMTHNTVLQLLGSMGGFGLLAYGFYRLCSLRPFIARPSFIKSMLGIAMLTVLGGSLLDNFIFNILPMFTYAVLMAIVYKIDSEARPGKRKSLF